MYSVNTLNCLEMAMHLLLHMVIIPEAKSAVMGTELTINPQFCKIVHQLKGNPDNNTRIFSIISYDDGAAETLSRLSTEIRDLPGQLVQFNKILLSRHLISMGLDQTNVYLYALRFLHDMEELYHSVPLRVTFPMMEQKMEKLMVSIILHAANGQFIGYSSDELAKCLRTSELVLQTLDIFSDSRTVKWYQNFLLGLNNYHQLKRVVELAGSFLALGPSRSCQDSLNRLAKGCYPSNLNSLSSGSTICSGFCVNVIRGCLAPPFLFLPNRAIRYNQSVSWYQIVGQSRSRQNWISSTMDLLAKSLNYSFILELIQAGLDEVRNNAAVLKIRLQTLCGDVPTSSTSLSPSTTSSSQITQIPDIYTEQLETRKQKLNQFINELTDKLNRIALNLANTQLMLNSVERFYCFVQNSKSSEINSNLGPCWNGTAYAEYQNNISAFTERDQLNNPEVQITHASLQLNPLAPLSSTQSEDNTVQDPSVFPLRNHAISNGARPLDYESSGFIPPNIDVDLLPQLIPNGYSTQIDEDTSKSSTDMSKPSVEHDNHYPLIQGCTADDEDCDLEINESQLQPGTISEAVQNELAESSDVTISIEPTSDNLNLENATSATQPVHANHSRLQTERLQKKNLAFSTRQLSARLVGSLTFLTAFAIRF